MTVTFDLDRGGLAQVLQTDVVPWLQARAQRVETCAASRAPVDTGRLAGSIRLDGPEITVGSVRFYVVAATEYAIYQEFGTRYMGAQPFLRPCVQAAFT